MVADRTTLGEGKLIFLSFFYALNFLTYLFDVKFFIAVTRLMRAYSIIH